jgi:hypothetical protein
MYRHTISVLVLSTFNSFHTSLISHKPNPLQIPEHTTPQTIPQSILQSNQTTDKMTTEPQFRAPQATMTQAEKPVTVMIWSFKSGVAAWERVEVPKHLLAASKTPATPSTASSASSLTTEEQAILTALERKRILEAIKIPEQDNEDYLPRQAAWYAMTRKRSF